MLTICARWEDQQMHPKIEWRMWRQLKGAFNIYRFAMTPIAGFERHRLDQYETFEEALDSCEGERVFLEPTGHKSICDIPKGNIVLILGNTTNSNMEYAQRNQTYSIATPNRTDMYGMNAAAIALAYRYEC